MDPTRAPNRARQRRHSALAIVLGLVLSSCGGGAHRTADETLPATVSAMEVEWSQPVTSTGAPTGAPGSRHVEGPAVATVVAWLNALPVQTTALQGTCSMGLFAGSFPVFTFHTQTGTLVFSDEICRQVKVTVNGRARPTLVEDEAGGFREVSVQFMRDTLHVPVPPAS